MSTSNFPFVSRVVDIIPQSDSAENNQNSEPSIGVIAQRRKFSALLKMLRAGLI
jgi:hypothetical protein